MDADMNKDDSPQAGECWSLKSCKGGPSLSPAVVLMHLGERRGKWLALPLFMESGMAVSDDVKLEPEPEFLCGENWCATSLGVEIDESRLFGKLGELHEDLFRELRRSHKGGPSRLRRGTQILKQLPDPRLEFHQKLHTGLRKCGSIPVLEAAASAIRVSVKTTSDSLTAWIHDLRQSVDDILLDSIPIPAPSYRNPEHNCRQEGRWKLPVPGLEEPVEIELVEVSDGWHFQFIYGGIEEISGESENGDRIEFAQLGEALWTSIIGRPLRPGFYTIRIKREDTIYTINLDLDPIT